MESMGRGSLITINHNIDTLKPQVILIPIFSLDRKAGGQTDGARSARLAAGSPPEVAGEDGDPCNDTQHDEHVPSWELTYQGTFEDDFPFPQLR